eukprot:XP_003247555.1 PREDICTED: Down syndrome cell adhesion molecule-like protein Dscam2 [Acyrthosiphon pisum]
MYGSECLTMDNNQIVTWLKDGVPRKSSSSTPPTYTLNVDSVQKDDQGMYQCVVSNKLNNEMAHSFAELRLSASKPTLKYKFIGHLLKPGPDVSLKCIAFGTPTPHITWKFDGNDVSLSQMRISVSQYVTEIGDVVSHFNITKVQVEDGGLYECIVSNRAGQVSHSAKIQVYVFEYCTRLLTGADTPEAALEQQSQLIALCNQGQFQLREWASNSPAILQAVLGNERAMSTDVLFHDELEALLKILGMQWNPK